MRVYEGIGPNKGKVIYGDSDARALMYEQIGIEPINGWENIDPEFMRQFDRDMLDWWYSGSWITYSSENEFGRRIGRPYEKRSGLLYKRNRRGFSIFSRR